MVHAKLFCNAKNGLTLSGMLRLHLTDLKRCRRALNDTEKKGYIGAVKCLQSQPAHNTSRPKSWTRFDEFQAHHIEIAINIHYVVSFLSDTLLRLVSDLYVKGEFLPWHRHLVKAYETALRDECGYKGAQP